MEIPIEALAAGAGFLGSLVVIGITYGKLTEKVESLREFALAAVVESRTDRKELRDEHRNFVTHNHLGAVVSPIQESLQTLESDVKEILKVVSK